MKREAIICDMGCSTLADFQCLLCSKDLCVEHGKASLLVTVTAQDPQPSAPGVTGEVFIDAQMTKKNSRICRKCWLGLRDIENGSAPTYVRTHVFEKLVGEFMQAAIAAAKAAIAQRMLERS